MSLSIRPAAPALVGLLLLGALAGCLTGNGNGGPAFGAPQTLEVTSPAFSDGGQIPSKHTCDGQDVSPALRIGAVPDAAARFALIMDDPDAPSGTFTHWTFWNLPLGRVHLAEGTNVTQLGAAEGEGSAGTTGYKGPCPPSGEHRYRFKVYALREPITLEAGASRGALESALDGHVAAWGELVGLYARPVDA